MIDFGLMFFASSEEAMLGDKYRLVLESARFADTHGFSSVWLPERHFTEFGSLYPNPAVLHAAIAASTRRVRLQAGSVVAPLHHPARIAEEWSMVDNLSQGRVGISFAAGWNPNDFVLAPAHYHDRAERLLADIATVQRLWRGESFEAENGVGEHTAVRVYPTPVQPELPIWLTVAGNPRNFERAGELGLNLLTHLLDQDEAQLAEKIALYRRAREANGWDPAAGRVSVMLHTFVGANAERVRELARGPYCDYIRQNVGLLNGLARSRGQQVDLGEMSEDELRQFVEFLYERFAQSRGLIGTPESCLPLVRRLDAIGVDEAACLLDFGPPVEQILDHLVHLDRLRKLASPTPEAFAEKSSFDVAAIRDRCPKHLDGEAFDRQLREYGLQISGDFQLVRQVWRGADEALAELAVPVADASGRPQLSAPFLDACSRVVVAALDPLRIQRGALYLPSGVAAIRVHRPLVAQTAWSHAQIHPGHDETLIEADVRVCDEAGRDLISLRSLRLRRVAASALGAHSGPAANAVDTASSLLYRRDWHEVALPATAGRQRRDWVLLGGPAELAKRWAAGLFEGADSCRVQPDSDSPAADLAIALNAPCSDIVMLDALELSEGAIEAGAAFTARVLAMLREVVQRGAGAPRLWLITSGGWALRDGQSVWPAQAALSGLAQSIAIEHPSHWGGLLDFDPSDPEPIVAGLQALADLPDGQREAASAWRAGRLSVPRLHHMPAVAAVAIAFDPHGSYLITGGGGGLAKYLADWLLEHGAGAVALLGRSLDETGANVAGASLHRYRCDVGERRDVAASLRQIRADLPPLKGVFHLAGTLDDARLLEQDDQRFRAAGQGKLAGAWFLHELTRTDDLEHFVMFSSLASLVTMPGQGNYATANAFLDGLAWHRRAEGLPALSVNWGPWGEIGHARGGYGKQAHARLAAMGVDALAPVDAIHALGQLLGSNEAQVAVAAIDWHRVAGSPMAELPALLDLLESIPAKIAGGSSAEDGRAGDPLLLGRLRETHKGARLGLLLADLKSLFAEVLRIEDVESLSLHKSLFDLGLDSILALDLTRRLGESYGQSFQATLFFTHPSLQALAEHVLSVIEPQLGSALPTDPVAPATSPTMAVMPLHSDEDELSRLIAEEIGRR